MEIIQFIHLFDFYLCGGWGQVIAALMTQPVNVTLTSINMGAVLEWRPPPALAYRANLTYTAEYDMSLGRNSLVEKRYKAVCVQVKALHCDFGALPTPYGIYTFRVRAVEPGKAFQWAKTTEFTPDVHSIIGPPTVFMVLRQSYLELTVTAPKFKMSSLSQILGKPPKYKLTYWKEDSKIEVKEQDVKEGHTRLTISDVKLGSRVCLQAAVISPGQRKSLPSQPVCALPPLPDKIGPLVISLVWVDGLIDVNIHHQVLKSIGHGYGLVTYLITYWMEGEENQVWNRSTTELGSLKLPLPAAQLEKRCCVQAQFFIQTQNITEDVSNITCIRTPSSLYHSLHLEGFLALLSIMVMLLFTWCSYRGFRFLYPNARLPEHFKQYMLESPGMALPLVFQSHEVTEVHYDRVSAVLQVKPKDACHGSQEPENDKLVRQSYYNVLS
ncbi:uncharacterized protein LOC114790515 isoform X2 [Denticeps clupeoides]|uniref:uncharacterized protein LOC114790515 isoform X2 n=1 Tax=Denticeps clupeoides TaxID=299321 RepID=UPI0010A4F33B|nr:uncharacterized protein LOC114790515 isoform X2 [Denticeps clupeoides]